jgi:hypothetical protein
MVDAKSQIDLLACAMLFLPETTRDCSSCCAARPPPAARSGSPSSIQPPGIWWNETPRSA